MKIGILTQALATNYGGILQNYALQEVLKKMGHEPFTFDVGKYTWDEWVVSNIKVTLKKCIGRKCYYRTSPMAFEKSQYPLRRFVYKYIKLTTPKMKRPNLSLVKKYDLDAIIIGSDQVWRPQYNPNIEDSFLGFAQGLDIKRVAYAASFGKDIWEFSPEQTIVCTKLAQAFDAISVRELTGVDMCYKNLNVKAKHVLDPTFLLNKQDYEELCKYIEKPRPFVFAYLLEQTPEKIELINEYADKKKLSIIIKGAEDKITDKDSIELWISQFRDAKCIFTDSFHGTAFSIIFNKDFYVFYNGERGNSRFDSLLSCFNLNLRIINKSLYSDQPIDWKNVNTLLKELKEESYEWLLKGLL